MDKLIIDLGIVNLYDKFYIEVLIPDFINKKTISKSIKFNPKNGIAKINVLGKDLTSGIKTFCISSLPSTIGKKKYIIIKGKIQ